jgi:NADH dehydrogenase
VIETLLRVTGRRRLLLPLPFGLMRFQAALLESIHPALFRRPPPLSRDQLVMLQEDSVGQPEAAIEQFGLNPVSFEAGLSAYLRTRAERE